MLSRILLVATFVATSFGQTAGNVGMSMSLSESVIMQAKDVYMDLILKKLAYVQLPDYNEPDSKNYAHGNYFTIS